MVLDISDVWNIALLALCVWREARSEPTAGKVGVAWSIKNRVGTPHAWWGTTYGAVITKPYQYSSFNSDDPNATKIPGDPAQDPSWTDCLAVAQQVYSNSVADPTNGSTHYCVASMNPLPEWTKTAEFKIKIGSHNFYRAS